MKAIEKIHSDGTDKIHLVGLSNGAVGAAAISNEFKEHLSSLLLLFGNYETDSLPNISTLILYADSDERFPKEYVKYLVERQMENNQYITSTEVSGDHFALFKK